MRLHMKKVMRLDEKSDKTIKKVIRLHKDECIISCVYVIKGGLGATPPAS